MSIVDQLTPEAVAKARDICTCYQRAHVERRKDGTFDLSTAVGLSNSYSTEYLGAVDASELFSDEADWRNHFAECNPEHVYLADSCMPKGLKRGTHEH